MPRMPFPPQRPGGLPEAVAGVPVDLHRLGVRLYDPILADSVRLVQLLLVEGVEVARRRRGDLNHEIGRPVDFLFLDPVGSVGRNVEDIGLHDGIGGKAHVHRGDGDIAVPLRLYVLPE
jgi:hypothetical protein